MSWGGEIFDIIATLAVVGILIAFGEWLIRNMPEALDFKDGRVVRLSSFGSSLLRSLAASRFNPARKQTTNGKSVAGGEFLRGEGAVQAASNDTHQSGPRTGREGL